MNYLAVDTSNSYLTVVARKGDKVFSSLTPDCAMKHSILLMEKIDEAFNALDMKADDCDFFSAVVGAGSFTGIRIGISAIKGFALATGKPTLPITSFESLSYNSLDEKTLCLIDALHGYYYACGYDKGVESFAPAYISQDEVVALQKAGYSLYSFEKLPLETMVVCPKTGLQKAVETLCKQREFSTLEALYIRKSSAEINAGR